MRIKLIWIRNTDDHTVTFLTAYLCFVFTTLSLVGTFRESVFYYQYLYGKKGFNV